MSDQLSAIVAPQRHAGDLYVLYVRMAPGTVIDGHAHGHPTIVLILEGTLVVVEDGELVHEAEGTVRLSPAHSKRELRAAHGADCIIISCGPASVVGRHAIWRSVPESRSARYCRKDENVTHVSRVRELVVGPGTSGLEAACLSLLNAMPQNGTDRRGPPWLDAALVALSASGGRRGACREIARELQIHPGHLGRVVRQFTGLTVRDYLRRARLMHGSRMLRAQRGDVSEVAHATGFADHSHFTREFVRYYGHSPSADTGIAEPDVASVQASEFPAVQLGRVSSG